MYKTSKLLKSVLGKIPNNLTFYAKRKSLLFQILHKFTSNILKVITFLKVLSKFLFY